MSCPSWLQHATAFIYYSMHMVFASPGPLSCFHLPRILFGIQPLPFHSIQDGLRITGPASSTILITGLVTKAIGWRDKRWSWVWALQRPWLCYQKTVNSILPWGTAVGDDSAHSQTTSSGIEPNASFWWLTRASPMSVPFYVAGGPGRTWTSLTSNPHSAIP